MFGTIVTPLRSYVSGKRIRLKENGFNLDISYITRSILAMSFPASDFKALYRNSASDVSRFLETTHPNYWIYNLSNKDIDEALFKNHVNSYPWIDHHSPPLLVLFQCCDHIYDFLLKDSKNVAILHCNAGKGRTGTAISCFLMYSGLADNFLNAIIFYGHKRFENGRGVT